MKLLSCTSIQIAAVSLGCVSLSLVLASSPASARGSKPPKSSCAGYSATASITTESATVTLPTITCSKNNTDIDVQLNAYDTENSQTNWAEVYTGCYEVGHHIVSQYYPYVFVDGSEDSTGSVSPNPGDTIAMTVSCGAGSSAVTLDDVATSESVTDTSSSPSSCTSTLGGGYGSTSQLPGMNSFGWTDVTVNSNPLSSISPTASNYYERPHKATHTTGSLTGGGTAFRRPTRLEPWTEPCGRKVGPFAVTVRKASLARGSLRL